MRPSHLAFLLALSTAALTAGALLVDTPLPSTWDTSRNQSSTVDEWLRVEFERQVVAGRDYRGEETGAPTEVISITARVVGGLVTELHTETRDASSRLTQATLLERKRLLLRLYDSCTDDVNELPTSLAWQEVLRDTAGPTEPQSVGFRRTGGKDWVFEEPGYTYRLSENRYEIRRAGAVVSIATGRTIRPVAPARLELAPCP